jgi:RNA polymerase sigma factor (sigma-70 family)
MPTVLLRAQTDERLARLAALGSDRAFEAIVERYRRPLLGYARRIVGDSRAEDVVQAAFVNAWARMRDGAEVRDLRAWLFRIVHNGAVNQLRRASASDVELLDSAAEPRRLEDDVERRETMRAALGGIARLPEPQRAALLGSVVQGRRNREIGDELGVTEGAVKMLVHRARSSVRAAAAAVVPFPLLVKLTGASAGAGAAGTTGAGAGAASAGLLGGTALKAAAVVACAGVVGTAAPAVVPTERPQPTASAPAAASSGASTALRPALAAPTVAAARPAPTAPRSAPHRSVRKQADPVLVAQAPADPGSPAPAAAAPAAPAPAPTPAPDGPAAGGTEQHDTTTRLPDRDFLDTASTDEDDDLIDVPVDPPDPARGEQAIPAAGVPDDIAGTVNLDTPSQPDTAAEVPQGATAPDVPVATAP